MDPAFRTSCSAGCSSHLQLAVSAALVWDWRSCNGPWRRIAVWCSSTAQPDGERRSPSTFRLRAARRKLHNGRCPIHTRSEEHTSELQSQSNLVCRLLLEKKKYMMYTSTHTL